jgi:hypothetical protein
MPMPLVTLRSERLAAISPKAVKLLLDLCSQWNGRNNGDLSAALSILRGRGWRSATTLSRATSELLTAGFIARTRLGGRHRCALFALTWLALSESDNVRNKLDADLVRAFRRGAYLDPWYKPAAPSKAPAMATWKKNDAPKRKAPCSGLLQKVEQPGSELAPLLQIVEQSVDVS